MALKNLSTESMISISSAWIDPKEKRKEIEAVPQLAALLANLDDAHAQLLAAQKPGGGNAIDEALAQVSEQARETDELHDRQVRGIYYLLTGLGELNADPVVRKGLLDLRDHVVPKGLATVNLGYLDEAGAAKAAEQRLDAPTRASLKKVKTHGGRTLDDEMTSYVAAGQQLAALEAKRVALDSERAKNGGVQRGDAQRARNRWIKTVNAFLGNTDLVAEDGTNIEAILAALRDAEKKADRRGTRKADAPAPGGADEAPPATPPGTPTSGAPAT